MTSAYELTRKRTKSFSTSTGTQSNPNLTLATQDDSSVLGSASKRVPQRRGIPEVAFASLFNNMKRLLPKDPPSDADSVFKILQRRREERKKEIDTAQKIKWDSQNPTLHRSVLLSPDNRQDVLLLTRTSKKGDKLVGSGGSKKIKYAISLATGEVMAAAICKKDKSNKKQNWEKEKKGIQSEASYLERFRNVEQVTKLDFAYMSDLKCILIMEFCEGGHLKDYWENNDLDESQQLTLLRDIIAGMKAIHDQGVLHRDIKAENCLIKNGRVKIADLGLACDENDREARKDPRGTPHMFSPEQCKAFAKRDQQAWVDAVTKKADIWAVGCVLFELLSNGDRIVEPSNDHFGAYAKIMRLTRGDIDSKIQSSGIPQKFHLFLENLLKVDPQDRAGLTNAEATWESLR